MTESSKLLLPLTHKRLHVFRYSLVLLEAAISLVKPLFPLRVHPLVSLQRQEGRNGLIDSCFITVDDIFPVLVQTTLTSESRLSEGGPAGDNG